MTAVIGNRPEHFRRLGLDPEVIEAWENGLRTGAADGTFEWWYLDCHLDDGSTLTLELHTKPPYMSPSTPLTPFVLLTLARPDGTEIQKTCTATADDFSASTACCDVTIGPNSFKGDADGYTVHVEIDEIVADVELTAEVPPWRAGTGHVFFGDDQQDYIAWLPVVSRGTAAVTLTIDGRTERHLGTGYHDHNWGNIAPRHILDHWYWGRARLGDYSVVTLMFVSDEVHDLRPIPVCTIAKGDTILRSALGTDEITFGESDHHPNATTGVPVAHQLVYDLGDQEDGFTVTFRRRQDGYLLDFGAVGAYHRFHGDVTLEHRADGQTTTVEGPTMWELLHFGPRP
jgi:hypothetical protein